MECLFNGIGDDFGRQTGGEECFHILVLKLFTVFTEGPDGVRLTGGTSVDRQAERSASSMA